ncbi:MAG: extracellular solute-binding protein [Deltaproteobacteria bacterium]|nr:extracellular solute-binding protein [Deltaproteobacteria bacterium]
MSLERRIALGPIVFYSLTYGSEVFRVGVTRSSRSWLYSKMLDSFEDGAGTLCAWLKIQVGRLRLMNKGFLRVNGPGFHFAAAGIVCAICFGFSHAAQTASKEQIEGAKKEGEVVLYASMNLSEANAMISRFEQRYPFVKVRLNRTGSEKLLTKVLAESAAKKSFADVIQTVEFSMYVLARKGVLGRYSPVENVLYPKEYKEDGFWTTVYYHPYVLAYNTQLVPAAILPKTYQDLLDPQWKGQMMIEGTKAEWFAGMLQIMGKEKGLKFMKDLSKQKPVSRVGHELLAQLVAAGEGLFDINIPSSSVDRAKARGAPIDWTALGPAPTILVGIGMSSRAPHPHAARLYLDFVLSKEGQSIIRSFGRLVARSDLAQEQASSTKGVKMVPINPALADHLDEYAKQLREIFSQ